MVKRSKKIVPAGKTLRICGTMPRSSGPAKTITRTVSFRTRWSASSTKRSSGQSRVLLPAPGKTPTSSSRVCAFSFFSNASDLNRVVSDQVVRELDKTFERPEPRAAAGTRKDAHQQFASLRLLFLQQCFNYRIRCCTRPERRSSRYVLDSQRLQHIEITIDEMCSLYFFNRLRFEVREEVERTIRAT